MYQQRVITVGIIIVLVALMCVNLVACVLVEELTSLLHSLLVLWNKFR